MLFSGVVDIMIFATAGSSIYGSGWFLVDGILTVLLSIFLLCNQMFTMMTLLYSGYVAVVLRHHEICKLL